MKAKKSDLARLEEKYNKSGNQLVVLYGRKGCQKEQLIKEFIEGKKFFYYRCRQASAASRNADTGHDRQGTARGHEP